MPTARHPKHFFKGLLDWGIPMTVHILDALAREGFEEVIALFDRDSGLWGPASWTEGNAGPLEA